MEPIFKGDTRFYPGYHWVYESDPRIGRCLTGATPEAAIEAWADKFERLYYQERRTLTLYSLAGPDAEPVKHEVSVGGRD